MRTQPIGVVEMGESRSVSWRRTIAVCAAVGLLIPACSGDDGSEDGDRSSTTSSVDADAATSTEPSSTDGATTTNGSTGGDGDGPITGLSIREFAPADSPTYLAAHPESGDLYVSERAGRVVRLDEASGESLGEVVDISPEVSTDGERGLLGIAIDEGGDYLYLSFSGLDGETRVDEFPLDDSGEVFEGERRSILELEQPFENHNGGMIAFGPDGYLYLGLGDGGGGGDPLDVGQDPTTWLGSILRIDPSVAGEGDRDYGIPADNPFADGKSFDGVDGAPEVWLWGVRNPWRFSWDAQTGDLWVGDVGQESWEEIDLLPAPEAGRGANLGWSEMEGKVEYEDGSEPADHVPPVHAYDHSDGSCSVTGGVVYRGEEIPELDGVYLYGDLCRGRILGLRGSDPESSEVLDLGLEVGEGSLVGFAEGIDSEVFVVGMSGMIFRLEKG